MKHLYTAVALWLFAQTTLGQCLTNVDFNTWSQAGYPANGNWVVQAGGNQVRQTVNGNPTFFVSPFDLMNVSITGDFRTTNSDDDMMGFVFCFRDPMGASDNYDTWLFDWKQGAQASGGYTAQAGKALSRLNGSIPSSDYSQTIWGHQNTPAFTCVANDFPGAGWVQNQTHTFQIDLSYTRAVIYVDGVLVFDHVDCYTPGRFGFYNYSQQDCYYSNFQYTMNVGFSVAHQQTCMGDSAIFDFLQPCSGANFGLAQYQSLRWDYGDGTVVTNNSPTLQNVNSGHIYNTPGTYNVQLIVTDVNGCADTATEQVIIAPKPVAAFAAPGACVGYPASFTDQTTGTPTSWQWDFSNGNSSNIQNPSANLGAVGQHPVTLYIEDALGCKDTVSQQVSVFAPPVADFVTDTVCHATATNYTYTGDSSINTYLWQVGEASITYTSAAPSHIYSTAGAFNATLIVNDANGCADTAVKQVIVKPNPVANFSTNAVCEFSATYFANPTTGAASYVWAFGDGANSIQVNPAHTYAMAGTYSTTLIAVSSLNCADTLSQQVVVLPKPVANFTVNSACLGANSVINNTSAINGGSITNYNWYMGDGMTSTMPTPPYVYSTSDTFDVMLIIESDQQCLDTAWQQAVVHPKPVVDFTFNPVCLNQSNTFTDVSTVSSGSISQWTWDFGDAQASTTQNPNHLYTAEGIYTVGLVVTTNQGCTDSVSHNITVYDKPLAGFTVSEECQGVANVFTDGSTIGNGTINQWIYSFGDSNTDNQQNTSHLYNSSGTYTSNLIVTTTNGCSDTATQTVTVNPRTNMAFSFADVCHGIAAVFTNQSTISTGSVSAWAWTLGDGNSTTTQSGSNLYAQPGNYSVQLKATSDKGCEDSITHSITIFDLPQPSTSITPACYGEGNGTATINATGGTPSYNYLWSNGTGNQTNTGLQAGTYQVTITDANTCTATASAVVHEPSGPLMVSTNPEQPSIELNETVTISLTNSYLATVGYNITPAYGLSCTNCEVFDAMPYKTTEYIVDMVDSLGCTGTGTFTVVVDQAIPVFIPNVFTPNGDGQNDTWTVYTQALHNQKVQIYNRIGEVVFESEDDNPTWDGTYKGAPAPMGIYTYVVSFVWLNSSSDNDKVGTIQLLR